MLLIRGGLPVGAMSLAKNANDTEGHGVIWENGYASAVFICMAPVDRATND